jgi:hypothetical protein
MQAVPVLPFNPKLLPRRSHRGFFTEHYTSNIAMLGSSSSVVRLWNFDFDPGFFFSITHWCAGQLFRGKMIKTSSNGRNDSSEAAKKISAQ